MSRPRDRVARSAWAPLVWALLVGVVGCGPEAAPGPPPPVRIGPEDVVRVEPAIIEAGPMLSGTLQPRQIATVRAEVAGAVREVLADRGSDVAEGQVIVILDDATLRDQLVAARSALRYARNALEIARVEERRARTLAEAGGLAQRDLDQAVAQVKQRQAQLADAQARLAAARQQVSRTRVRTPFAGVLSERPANQGDIAQVGTALFTVVDPSTMRLVATLPAQRLDLLRPGAPVEFTVTGFGDRLFRGEVERVYPVVDPATGQVRADVAIPNIEGRLLGGLAAQGRLVLDRVRALAAPLDAVDFATSPPTVMRVREGMVERVPVELGVRDEVAQRVAIAEGLAQGDLLLRQSAQGAVSPGTAVRVLTPERARGRTPPRRQE